MNIHHIKRALPINFGEFKLELLSDQTVEEYAKQMFKRFYNEYSVYDYRKECSYYELVAELRRRIKLYREDNSGLIEFRMVIVNKNKEVVGGVKLACITKTNEIEVAYFLVPEYQGKNIAYSIINKLLYKIYRDCDRVIFIANVIRENKKSVRLLEKLGFFEANEENNIIKMRMNGI